MQPRGRAAGNPGRLEHTAVARLIRVPVEAWSRILLWIKTAHILGVISWLAGVFYLPRLLINAREGAMRGESIERLQGMSLRLLRFMTLMAAFAIGFGLWLWLAYDYTGYWLHAKLVLVVGLVGYHAVCWRFVRQLVAGRLVRSPLFLRIFNELSLVLIAPILILAVVKPF